ncbi:MAG: CDP-glycerol glycerophosphotransferase family protein [Leucobacter sp.]
MRYARFIKRGVRYVLRRVPKAFKYYRAMERLRARPTPPSGKYRVAVYFADSKVNLYQLRQWYGPLRELSKQVPVTLLTRNACSAEQLLDESGLDVHFAHKITEVETFLEQQPIDVVLYVNQNSHNFRMMRYGQRWHVFISHGESDKKYMASSQLKAYDYTFVAGDAARDRLTRALWRYDVDERTIAIGRPQADFFDAPCPLPNDERTVVFYAPTWEGDRPSMKYGSVRSHGVELVRQLITTGRHRIVYRPHPRTGVIDSDFGAANQQIISLLTDANLSDPQAGHVVDESPSINWQIRKPDVVVTDVSAMLYDRLAAARPLMVTRPVNPEAEIETAGYLSDCEWLRADGLVDVAHTLDTVIHDRTAQDRLAHWSEYYFGDTTHGEPTKRFIAAAQTLLDTASAQHEQHPEAGDL